MKVDKGIILKCFFERFWLSNIDLKCLFESIQRIPIAKNQLKPIIQDHIYQIGHQSIEQISMLAINVGVIWIDLFILCVVWCHRILKSMWKQSLKFMKNFVNLYKNFFWMIQFLLMLSIKYVFDIHFLLVLFFYRWKACVKVINTNGVTSVGKKSSEFLAHYCDKLLRNK
jgi:hypothetical protein